MSRARVALALASIALAAAVVGALGPADHVQSAYSWPPPELPSETPSRFWYTPLLLVRGHPETLTAHVPCSLPPALPQAARPVVVLATARSAVRNRGLAITQDGDALEIRIADRLLDRMDLAAQSAADRECAYRLVLRDGSWSVAGGPRSIERSGDLEAMPTVTGLFSALDLRSEARRPSVEVTTAVHDTRSTTRQGIARTVSVLAALAALVLVAFHRVPRPQWSGAYRRLRAVAAHAHPADGAVGVVLAVWWIVAPAVYDDGWVMARVGMYESSGGFSVYYSVVGTNLPLGYWHEWVLHIVTQVSSALVVLRLPVILSLATTWLLCRWILKRTLLTSPLGGHGLALWALASTFAVGTVAWGMTLRPEPVVAVLVTAVLACMVRYGERPAIAPLAATALLIPLAVVAHPAGIASLAPVLVLSPKIIRWARTRLRIAVTIVLAGSAVLTTVAFLGSDIASRVNDLRLNRAYGGGGSNPWDELDRYRGALVGASTPTVHVSVMLILLVVVSYLVSRRGERDPLRNLPGAALIAGLVLLVATPSKWTPHLAGLVGVTAVAVAIETARLQARARRGGRWALPFVVIAITVMAGVWAMSRRGRWNVLDLQTVDWVLGFEKTVTLADLTGVLPIVLVLSLVIVELTRRRRDRLREVPWRVASSTALVLALPATVFTLVVLVTDMVRTSSWTLARQNVRALTGDAGCGLGDVARVPALRSMRAVSSRTGSSSRPGELAAPPIPSLSRFVLNSSRALTPWFELPAGHFFGLFIADSQDVGEREHKLYVDWGRRAGGRIRVVGSEEVRTVEQRPDLLAWRFVSSPELPGVASSRADVVRVRVRGSFPHGFVLGATAPVVFETESVAQHLGGNGRRSLVLPNVLTLFPCASLPRLSDGVVQVPGSILGFANAWPVGLPTSPFTGLVDLYPISRLPLFDAGGDPRGAVYYGIDRRIAGGRELPPSRRTLTS